ncbi:hypothetical protein [Halorubellus litoreus]|uniref:Uncharacterized protein n=1 Tax=Halorubellus litoreus TaxID=755308 RepID=A0ABD5VG87_9EURY
MSPLTVPIIFVLLAWIAVTILNSTERSRSLLRRIVGDFAPIIPGWSFFAPTPGQVDYHLFYRDKRVDGSKTAWQRVPRFGMERKWTHLFWNTDIYRDKALFDVVEHFTSTVADEHEPVEADETTDGSSAVADEENAQQLELEPVDLGDKQGSILYMSLLNCVSLQDHSRMSDATQFAIMANSREQTQYEPIYISQFHKLEQ